MEINPLLVASFANILHPFLPHLFNIDSEVLATTIKEEREVKRIQIGKEERTLSLFSDDMMLYIENTKSAIRKILEFIN